MQQLCITILAMLSVIAPIAIGKLHRMLITPRLLKLFQHIFLTTSPTEAIAIEASRERTDVHQFAGMPDWEKLLAYARSGRNFCIAFACRLFPKPMMAA
jgi:acyl-CoA dehydrogenase